MKLARRRFSFHGSVAVWVGLVAGSALGDCARAEEFFFRDGDRAVIMGDSITEQHLYSTYIEMWTVCRFPTWKITFRNVGIGGDRSVGGNSRFARDVLAHQATALTVDFGMNDGGYRAFDPATFKVYKEGLEGIASQAKQANIRVAWITPSPVEKNEDGPAMQGYNETLEKYSAGVSDVASASGALFVDQFHPFVEAQDRARAADAKNRIGGGDPVHPGPSGQALMAWAILKGLHFPTLVSSAKIDAAKSTASGENCEISAVKAAEGGVTFMRLDKALPFFPADAANILKWVPIREELNQYLLQVANLKTGNYDVLLGGKKVARHSADELAKGVNLAEGALAEGPVADQVNRVREAVQAKNSYLHDRIFRGVILATVQIPDFLDLPLTNEEIEAKRQAAFKERLAKAPEYDAAIHEALEIHAHEVRVVPVK